MQPKTTWRSRPIWSARESRRRVVQRALRGPYRRADRSRARRRNRGARTSGVGDPEHHALRTLALRRRHRRRVARPVPREDGGGGRRRSRTTFARAEWAALEDKQAEAVLEAPSRAVRQLPPVAAPLSPAPAGLSPRNESAPRSRSAGSRRGDGSTPTCSRSASSTTARTSIDQARDRLCVTAERRASPPERVGIVAALENKPPHAGVRAQYGDFRPRDRGLAARVSDVLSWRNQLNETSDEAVEALIGAIVGRYDIMQRHYRLRARLLGIEKLADYDRFAPVSEPPRMSWNEARELITDAYESLLADVGDRDEVLRQPLDRRYHGRGKRPARTARCACPRSPVHPDDVRGVAAECAHARARAGPRRACGALAGRRLLQQRRPAHARRDRSVLGEAITFRQLLDHSETKERIDLLVAFIDEIAGTVFGAMAANRFEDAAHRERRDEASCPRRGSESSGSACTSACTATRPS